MLNQDQLTERLQQICRGANLPCMNVSVGHSHGKILEFSWSGGAGSSADALYLVASITKPIVGMAAMRLVAEGRLRINDRVSEHLPKFNQARLRTITIRHLLTHTCGLPDMLPNNQQLRADHASLPEFVDQIARCDPDFAAGTDCRYSSMGFAVLGRVIELAAEMPLNQVLKQHFFQQLRMDSTWLGLPEENADQMASRMRPCQLPIWQSADCDWTWNSRYWRTLGAPWGGLISTAGDLGRYARMMLRFGLSNDGRVILPDVAVKTATTNQTRDMAALSRDVRLQQQWGYGWRMNWLGHSACFCELLPASTYGHWGATGTVMWICPDADLYAVILTTVPYELSQSPIQKISNLIAATCANVD